MNPEQALELLNQVASEYRGSRADHVRLQEAVNVLSVELMKANATAENASTAPPAKEPKK